MHFGHRFLKQKNPKLIAISLGEDWVTFNMNREVVVNSNVSPLAVLAKLKAVQPIFRICLSYKKTLDKLWHFRKGSKCAHEPAVSKLSLLNIIGLYFLLKDLD